jgi:D-alanine-D-alanine ligase
MDLNSLQENTLEESEKPPSEVEEPPSSWLVAVIANVKGEAHGDQDGPEDADAEFDRPETIQAIRDSIEYDGHRTVFLNADRNLPFVLREVKPDICFNIAEGKGSDSRETHVPALLAMYGIPYTASSILANAISLDKPLTKRLWRDAGLPVCPFQEFATVDEPLREDLRFPLFVKPSREGTGMGVNGRAKVHNQAELREQVDWVVRNYRQPALVENFLPGREFTVSVLGRADAARYSRRPELYAADGFHRFPVLEIDSYRCVTPGMYGHAAKTLGIEEAGSPGYFCPADVDAELWETLQNLAISAHNAIGALDISRVDIRLDEYDVPNLVEINTLPGLTPNFSDLCVMANTEGLSYRDLILEVLYLAASRHGLILPRSLSAEMRPNTWQWAKPVHVPSVYGRKSPQPSQYPSGVYS